MVKKEILKIEKILLYSIIFTLILFLNCLIYGFDSEAADYSQWSSVFDPEYYSSHNADAKAYASGNTDRLWTYFTKVGIPKGDQASEEFNVFIYAKNYPEIYKQLGGNILAYYVHYAQTGKAMGLNAKTLINSTTDQSANSQTSNNTTGNSTASLNNITANPDFMNYAFYKEYIEAGKTGKATSSFSATQSECKFYSDIMQHNDCLCTFGSYNHFGCSYTYYSNERMEINWNYVDNSTELAQVAVFVKSTAPSLKGSSDYETIKNVHDFICDNANYDNNTLNGNGTNFGAYENLILKSSVCMGYSLAFQYYMEYLGIPCYIASSNNHAWNIVYLEGNWYHIDTTWDGQDSKTRWDYFLLGSDKTTYSTFGDSYSPIITLATKSYSRK